MAFIMCTDQAEQDLIDLWLYISQRNRDAAERMWTRIERTSELLADSPKMGQARDELMKGLRSFPVPPYVIFYRPIRGGIMIVRIIHGARDLGAIYE